MPRFFSPVLGKDTTDCTGADTGSLQTLGGAWIAKQLRVKGIANFLDTTATTSYTNGSIVTPGGIGCGGLSSGSTITAVGAISGSSFSGAGSGLTGIPPAALLGAGVDGQALVKNGTSWNWVTLPTGSGGGSGSAYVDFGSLPYGSADTKVVITGQSSIVAGSAVRAWIVATTSPEHDMEEHWVEPLEICAGNIVAGVGFTIYAKTLVGVTYGRYNVQWAWN